MIVITKEDLSNEFVQALFCNAIENINDQIDAANSLLDKHHEKATTDEQDLMQYSAEIVELFSTHSKLKSAYDQMSPIWNNLIEISLLYNKGERVFGEYTTSDLNITESNAKETMIQLGERIEEEQKNMREVADHIREQSELFNSQNRERTAITIRRPVDTEYLQSRLNDLSMVTNSADDIDSFVFKLNQIVSEVENRNLRIVESTVDVKVNF